MDVAEDGLAVVEFEGHKDRCEVLSLACGLPEDAGDLVGKLYAFRRFPFH